MKRFNLFLFLLLTSLRLVASPGIVGEQSGKKAVFSTRHSHQHQDSGYADTVVAEETEEDAHGDDSFVFATLPVFRALLWFFFLSSNSLSLTEFLAASLPSQPLFVLFQNFRI